MTFGAWTVIITGVGIAIIGGLQARRIITGGPMFGVRTSRAASPHSMAEANRRAGIPTLVAGVGAAAIGIGALIVDTEAAAGIVLLLGLGWLAAWAAVAGLRSRRPLR